MKIIKLLTSILGILFLIILTLIIIDLRPHFDLITSDETIPEPYQSPSEKTINLRSDIVFLSASEMASKIREGSLSSVEVVEAHLSQIYKFNHKINAVITVDAEGALKRAKEADNALKKGQIWGPLHGVPFTVKDHLATKSIRTTSGFGPLKDVIPDYDATVVARLKKAGGILLGKTNMPPLAGASLTDNLVFGRTNNPWDLKRTVGGSSGGSAAALAVGMTPIEIGSDIGGSIRIPAHYNGVFGLKTTEHLISFHGALMPGMDIILPEMQKFRTQRHLASLGPMARSIEDLQLLLSIIAGPDPNDVRTVDIPISFPEPEPLQNMKIAWTDNLPGEFGGQTINQISNAYSAVFEGFVKKLNNAGVSLEEKSVSSKYMNQTRLTWGKLMNIEYDFFAPVLARIILSITDDPSAPYTVMPHSYENYQKILTERDRLRSLMDSMFVNFDAFVLPVSLDAAYNLPKIKFDMGMPSTYGSVTIDDREFMIIVADVAFTTIFNLTGNPVVVIPIGFTQEGMPVGVQIVGKRWRDAELLVVAQQLFKIGGDFRKPPGFIK